LLLNEIFLNMKDEYVGSLHIYAFGLEQFIINGLQFNIG